MNTPLLNILFPRSWDSDFLGYGVVRLPAHSLTAAALDEQLSVARRAKTAPALPRLGALLTFGAEALFVFIPFDERPNHYSFQQALFVG